MLSTLAALLPAWGWLLISIFFYAIGEYISKTWANSPTTIEVSAVVVLSALSAIFWLPALMVENKLAVIGTAWVILATISTVFIGTFFFHEELSTLQWFAIVLALISFVLLVAHHYTV